ncbi:MAG: T9SS type A sorting domain-containing protein [Bacteroidota bacterium]|nr:T9SS type A sorting domain-containing protein [Bacteroidota bacterium]
MKTLKIFLTLLTFSSFSYGGFDSLFVKVSGDTATVWHKNTMSNCVSKFEFEVTVGTDTITIVERDTVGPLVKCACIFDLNVRFCNVLGEHTVMVYRQLLKKYFYDKDTTYFIGSTSFMLPGPNQLPYFAIGGFQSPCGGIPVGVERIETSQPNIIQLTNYPNPFNSSTIITFSVSRTFLNNRIELTIFDVQGRLLKQLINQAMSEGNYSVRWDGTLENGKVAASGIYFYHLTVGTQRQIGKMSLIK